MSIKDTSPLAGRVSKGYQSMLASLAVNILLAAVKIIAGVLGSSYALIADGIESTMDIFASMVVLGGIKIGSLPPDKNHPYGHGKAETLAAMAVSLGLLAAAIIIAVESIKEIHTPHHAPAAFTLIVLVGVVLIKELMFRRLSSVGHSLNSLSIQTDAWHHRSDALTSLAAFIGISIALIFGKGYESADDWAALAASGIIAFNGIYLLTHAVRELMDHAVNPETETSIRTVAGQIEGVVAIEKCRVRKSGLQLFVDIHVEVPANMTVAKAHGIAHQVKDALIATSLGIADVLVHIEPARDR